MSAPKMQARLSQTASFSPRLQQAVRLLQMSTMDYAQALLEAAQANPFLEVDDSAVPSADEDRLADAPLTIPGDAEIDWAQRLDRMGDQGPPSAQRLSHDESFDHLQHAPAPVSLRQHLHAQLGVLRLDARDGAFARAVVEALDDDGYLRVSLEELGTAFGESGVDEMREWRMALRRVQALDPLGVAARTVSECLSLQLERANDPALRTLARRIARDHLDLLAARKLAKLSALLGTEDAAVQRAVEFILGLEARPGSRFSEGAARIVVPDVIVRKVRGVWKTALNGSAMPRVRVHESYAEMFEKHRQHDDAALKDCLNQARWTVQNAAQRVSTVLEIAMAIVERQKLFLEYGELAMKPLGLREVADEVGVHPSTVSRAVHHKYLATPHGVFELHHFFSRGMVHSGGGESAPIALQALIRDLIGSESADTRWSDAALARELSQQGFRIARRTVTKYRQGLDIESVERRRGASDLRLAAGLSS
ncbi:RNA polymerase factor sigma-54 [Variovorax sp. J22P271]|uniref:RNA polymerase factor sigma-54 n=1 Tax=Variovorax davisae TaxID=3053515 RepID=UPI002575DA1A|nr:RNA polymerase factor sigma-54 [Variovorax sp. J22P271]MDM0032166.1 RNA polymerase factor sigma-54 [Variovorax sp. J22P271]